MSLGILGRKVGMTQIFSDDGAVIPVTVIQAGPCHVLQVKTEETDGYKAVQVGYLDRPRRLASRSDRGHVAKLDSKRVKSRQAAGVDVPAKADCEPKKFVREFRDADGLEVGAEITVGVFGDVAAVDVTGVSKGRGFTGVMKRHNFAGQRATHGVKKVHRHTGGTSRATYPARVEKGLRMAGQYGSVKTTTRNLKVVRVDAENNLLLLQGAAPGPNGGLVVVRPTNKV